MIEVEHLSKGFGDRLLIEDLSFTLPPAGIVGIIGPNGAGKSTLFKMLAGREEPDSGSIKIGDTVDLSYVDQDRDDLDPDATVYEEITGGAEVLEVGGREIHGRAYVSSFNFKGTDHGKRVGDLSGGERNRVHLAKLLKSGGNVLLLDEPTNDLDMDTLRALEAGLESFPGCAVIISHDRWFLDRDRHPRAGVRGRQPGRAGSRATSPNTRSAARRNSAPAPTNPTASSTRSSPDHARGPRRDCLADWLDAPHGDRRSARHAVGDAGRGPPLGAPRADVRCGRVDVGRQGRR